VKKNSSGNSEQRWPAEMSSEHGQDWSQFWSDRTGSDFNFFENWWIGLRKFVVLMWLFLPHQTC